MVDDVVPLLPQMLDHSALELEAGVVGGDMDMHGQDCASREQRSAPGEHERCQDTDGAEPS